LHFGHSKIPTRNSGILPLAVRFAGATVQHLTAVATSVPQFGQATNETNLHVLILCKILSCY
jgi:hypothetical protein